MNRLKKGFTIVELLVVVAIIALLIAILLPAIGKAREAALLTQSMGNLRNLASANSAYGADWSDRQFTTVPDDAGIYGGSCEAYIAAGGCPPQQILGWDQSSDTIWGYFIACDGYTGGQAGPCGNWGVYVPIVYRGSNFGSFRMPNVKAFNSYLSGRFYDPVYYAPKDRITLQKAEQWMASPGEFAGVSGSNPVFSTYCWSPAAMWAPEVLSSRFVQGTTIVGPGYTDPATLPSGYKSPVVGSARYPELKTRMLEHTWLQNPQGGAINPSFTNETPYYFNHGINSAPATLFFDAHIAVVGANEAMSADGRVKRENTGNNQGMTETGLWSRGTGGYFADRAYDWKVNTAFHIATTDGILGRDVISQQ